MNRQLTAMTVIGALVAAMAMAGCSKQEQADAKTATNDAAAAVKQDAKDAAATASDKIGDKVDDAMVTASVKAELAKDAGLSALKINVDTDHGRVALRGTATSATARDHAMALAGAVKGVVSVDNQLTVEAGKS